RQADSKIGHLLAADKRDGGSRSVWSALPVFGTDETRMRGRKPIRSSGKIIQDEFAFFGCGGGIRPSWTVCRSTACDAQFHTGSGYRFTAHHSDDAAFDRRRI